MRFARVASRAQLGLDAPLIWTEVHLTPGLPAVNVVGMTESTVRDAKERVRSAIISAGFKWPDARITISLSPAEIPKLGARFDLPIAIGLLVASSQIRQSLIEDLEFYGELGLDGRLLDCKGLLSAVVAATNAERAVAIPADTAYQLPNIPGSCIHPLHSLADLTQATLPVQAAGPTSKHKHEAAVSMASHLVAQPGLCRPLLIAAAGGHHLLLLGEPGTGKTLSASTLPSLLPTLTDREKLEVQLIRDVAGIKHSNERPFRSPHHSASLAGLIGGTSRAAPGEITLAHCGVLFLDELAEFKRDVLETLRQPLESGEVTIVRAGVSHHYPARFQLVAAMNPCPCGYSTSRTTACLCSASAIQRYQSRLSGPLLDRFDLHVTLHRIAAEDILDTKGAVLDIEPLRQSAQTARERQYQRQGCLNAELSGEQIDDNCQLTSRDRSWLAKAANRLKLTARALHRCMRVARTLADMEDAPRVSQRELSEALGFRPTINNRAEV